MLLNHNRIGTHGKVSFRYYRIWITAYNNPIAVVISKWGLYSGNTDITQQHAFTTSQSGAYSSSYSSANLFNSVYTYGPGHHWQVNSPPVQWVEIGFSVPMGVDRFRISHDTSNSQHEAFLPKNWTFQGSNDRENWTNILNIFYYTPNQWHQNTHHDWYL